MNRFTITLSAVALAMTGGIVSSIALAQSAPPTQEEQFKQQIREQVGKRLRSPAPATRATAPRAPTPAPATTSWNNRRAQPNQQQANQQQTNQQKVQSTTGQAGVESWVQKAMQTQPTMAVGYNPNSGVCEQAITAAERQYNLPPYILHAIAITESGVKGRPYPHAMNIKGRAYYARNAQEMYNIVVQNGPTSSIDVGCVQVNLKWHGKRFPNWAALLDPQTNAQYAAFHLTELFREFGSWNAAVSAYHSRTAWRGVNYACLVSKNYGHILGDYRKGCGPSIEHLAAYLYANVRR